MREFIALRLCESSELAWNALAAGSYGRVLKNETDLQVAVFVLNWSGFRSLNRERFVPHFSETFLLRWQKRCLEAEAGFSSILSLRATSRLCVRNELHSWQFAHPLFRNHGFLAFRDSDSWLWRARHFHSQTTWSLQTQSSYWTASLNPFAQNSFALPEKQH